MVIAPGRENIFMVADKKQSARWMKWVLLAAGVYNIVWGVFVVAFPLAPFRWFDMELPNYPEIWQCVGMIVGVYGVGYAIAAFDPVRHWVIVLVGFLGKFFGPIGFVNAALQGKLSWSFGWVNVTNDLIWLVPFTLILYRAYQINKRNNSDSHNP
jgi:small multidrug resistance pump